MGKPSKSDNKSTKKPVRSIRISDEIWERFREVCNKMGMKRDDYIAHLISENLQAHKTQLLMHEDKSFSEFQSNLINTLNLMFDSIVCKNQELSDKNFIQEGELNSLKQEVESYKQQIEEYEVIQAAGDKINRKKNKSDDSLAVLNRAIEDKDSQISALQAKVAELEGELSTAINKLEALKAEIGNKDTQILELEEEQKIHDEIEVLKGVLSEKETVIANLTSQKSDGFKVRYDMLRDGEEPGVSFGDYIDFYVNAIKHQLNQHNNLFPDNYEIFNDISNQINKLDEYKNWLKDLHEKYITPIFNDLYTAKRNESTSQ